MRQQNSYQNSKIFGVLKDQKDKITENLTTSQYMEKLDGYLYSALTPILLNTNYLENSIVGLIGWQEKNFRRRVSLLTKKEFISLAVLWLLKPTKQEKLTMLTELKFDRGVLLTLCQSFLISLKEFRAVVLKKDLGVEDSKVLSQTELRFSSTVSKLSRSVYATQYRVDQALAYRGAILSKYYRLALLAAKRDYVSYFNHRISLDDMCAEYLLATSRAIDKCDYEKGPLASHVQNWFFTARAQCQKKYDNSLREDSCDFSDQYDAISLSTAQQHEEALTSEGFEDRLDESQNETIRFLAKIADPKGLARKILGIEEHLTTKEKKLLGVRP